MTRSPELSTMKTTTINPPPKSTAKAIPEGMHSVTPHLICANASEALVFYQKAFGAIELMRVPTPEGKLMHGSIRIGDSVVMLTDEFPQMGALGPKARNGTSVTIHLFVEDVDAAFARAVRAGATVKMPVQDMFWGDRYGLIEDPFGHSWSLATHQRDLTAEEIQEAAKNSGC